MEIDRGIKDLFLLAFDNFKRAEKTPPEEPEPNNTDIVQNAVSFQTPKNGGHSRFILLQPFNASSHR
ncbi:hypothetical protein Trydic_g10131 [Trypoxylus dichotomus]